ncbi:hypothetical protein HanXRQr2_Chr02g0079311 [Helianthus annuus]|uniref:Uncharacterized protein n=1 Tax=Helianthus annuus TaxID=4232 RepID=A0A9K3JQV7_HELAN|nr:hypothetical protein HanXRQr2_Chr02g0079311 [Helianthus annuus]
MHYTMFLVLVVLPAIVGFFVIDNVCISFLAPARYPLPPARNRCYRELYIFYVKATHSWLTNMMGFSFSCFLPCKVQLV